MSEEMTQEEAWYELWAISLMKMNLSWIKVGTASLEEKKTRQTEKM